MASGYFGWSEENIVKFAASRIEADVAAAVQLDIDWITLDGRAGGTGAAGKHVKDNICAPTVFAIPRAPLA